MNNKSGRRSFHERLDHFISKLRTDILNGTRQAGAYLPSESTLAKQFQLSNKSVRKGLELLVEEGLIVKIDRVGSMVTNAVQEKIRINFGCNSTLSDDFLVEEMLVEFHRLNPGIHVNPITLNSLEHVQSAQEMMDSGFLDVVTFNSVQFQEMVERGIHQMLEPLDHNSELYPIALDAFSHKEQFYAYPLSFSPVVLCYNRTHFQEAGIAEPDSYWTWNDLIHAAEKLSEARKRHSVYFVPASENRYSVFLLQSGLQVIEDDHNRRMLSPRTAQSLKEYSKLVNNHTIFPKYLAGDHADATIPLFKQEQVSMVLTSYFNLNQLKQSEINYDVSPLPTLERRDPQKSLQITIGAGVVSSTKAKDAACKLVEFLVSAEAQKIIRQRTVSIPANKQAAEMDVDDELNRPSRYFMFRELLPTFYHHKELGVPIHVLRRFNRSLNAYWSNMIDEQTLLDELGKWYSEAERTTEPSTDKSLV